MNGGAVGDGRMEYLRGWGGRKQGEGGRTEGERKEVACRLDSSTRSKL